MDKDTKNALTVIGGVLVLLLVISLAFSGRPSDAIYAGPAVHQQYRVADATPAEAPAAEDVEVPGEPETGEPAITEVPGTEVTVGEQDAAEEAAEAEAPAQEAVADSAPAEEATGEETPGEEAPVAEAPADEVPAEEAPAEAPVETAALAGDPDAGARTWRQCQACHQIGAGAQNRVGPQLSDIIDRPMAAIEGFRYSSALAARGNEGHLWTVESLQAFLADPRGYVPGTTMAFAGLRNPADIDNVIAYMATFEQ